MRAAAGGNDLKGLLDSSSYDNDVVKAYAGKTIKAAAKKGAGKAAGSYDLSVDVDASSAISTPPVESVQSAASSVVDTASPPIPASETIEAVTKTVKQSIRSVAPPEGLSVPADVQESMQKPVTALNSFLKSTQATLQESQRAAAERTASMSSASGGSSTGSSGKVPTMGEYLTGSLAERRESLGVVTQKVSVDIKIPEVTPPTLPDVKIPQVKMPDVKMPDVNVKIPDVKISDLKVPQMNDVKVPAFKLPEYTPPATPGIRMTEVTLPPPGKAMPFAEYLRAQANGAIPDDGSTASTMADIKAKLGIMVSNYYKMVGEDAPESLDQLKLPDFSSLADLPSKLSAFDYEKALGDLPESAPWAAVALGAFLVVAGASNNRRSESTKAAPKTMEAASAALGDLTDDLETLQRRSKNLEETSLSLQAELKAAKDKLLEKELEISKEKLKVADNQLTRNREVQRLEQKLKDNTVQVKSLDTELTKTRGESEKLKKELAQMPPKNAAPKKDPVATVPEELPSATVEKPTPAPKKTPSPKKKAVKKKSVAKVAEKLPTAAVEKPVAAPKKKAATKKKIAVKKEATTANSVEKATTPAKKAAPKASAKKATAKKAAPKRTAAKKGSAVVNDVPPTVFFADEATPPAPAPKKKAVAKKKTAAKAAAKDMSSLSKSTLARKTVKELSEYLETKGVSSTGGDGKPLKKADLVDAVLSL
ncbi:MAG: hypothetical protein SGILL_000297 [Bacillariaceae sp.]